MHGINISIVIFFIFLYFFLFLALTIDNDSKHTPAFSSVLNIHTRPFIPSLYNNPIFPTVPIIHSVPTFPADLRTICTCSNILTLSFLFTPPNFKFIFILFCIPFFNILKRRRLNCHTWNYRYITTSAVGLFWNTNQCCPFVSSSIIFNAAYQ